MHTIDNKRLHPNNLHTGVETYDFEDLDDLIEYLNSIDTRITINYCHIGCPLHLVDPQKIVPGPYGGTGEMSPLTSYAEMPAYWSALLTSRPEITVVQLGNEPGFEGWCYQPASSVDAAANTITFPAIRRTGAFAANAPVFFTTTGTLPAGISANTGYYLKTALSTSGSQAVQISLTAGGAAIDITGTGTGTLMMYARYCFWWGTPEELVDFCYYNFLAAKAANPNIIVVTPGVYGPVDFAMFLDATGPLSGVRGRDIPWDGIAIHPYIAYPNLRSGGMDMRTYYEGGVEQMRMEMTSRGFADNLPVYMSEYGVSSFAGHARTVEFNTVYTTAQRKAYMKRMAAAACRLSGIGVKQISFFSLGNIANLCGDMEEPGGSGEGIGEAHEMFAGKTLVNAYYDVDGVEHGIIDGESYSI
jgi:hypothetical protein